MKKKENSPFQSLEEALFKCGVLSVKPVASHICEF